MRSIEEPATFEWDHRDRKRPRLNEVYGLVGFLFTFFRIRKGFST